MNIHIFTVPSLSRSSYSDNIIIYIYNYYYYYFRKIKHQLLTRVQLLTLLFYLVLI